MDYKNYKKSRDLSWEILIRENITELPVRTSSLCRQMGISVRDYIPKDENDGVSFIANGKPFILVSSRATVERKRFTVAHELGHILLGHVGRYQLVNREPSPEDNPIEQAANVFASRLLAPACVLWGCGVTSAEQIAELCQISMQAAEFRMERMNLLYERNMFLTSPAERRAFEQFSGFIHTHKL